MVNHDLVPTMKNVQKFKMAASYGDRKWHKFDVNFLLIVHNYEWGLGTSEHRGHKDIKL